MGLDGQGVRAEGLAGRGVGQDEAQRLEGEPPAGRAGDLAAGDGAHPADIGDMGRVRERDSSGLLGLGGLRLPPAGLSGLGLGGVGLRGLGGIRLRALGAGTPVGGLGLAGRGLRVARSGGGGVGRGPAQGQSGRDREDGGGPGNSFHGAFHGKSPSSSNGFKSTRLGGREPSRNTPKTPVYSS